MNQLGEYVAMAASMNVIASVLTLTFSYLGSTGSQIIPSYQLAFVNQSALFTFNSNHLGVWTKSGASLFNCSCVQTVNNDSNQYQLYFNPITTLDANRYVFYLNATFTDPPTAFLWLLDVAVETNISDGGLVEWDSINVTCTLLFYNGYIGEQPAFSALINYTVNGGALKQVEFTNNTSTGNVTSYWILPASEQYHCTASFFDNVINNTVVLKKKTVTTQRYQLSKPSKNVNVNVSDHMTVDVRDALSCYANASYPEANVTWEKEVDSNTWVVIQHGSVLNLITVQNTTFRCTASNVIRGIVYRKSSDTFYYRISRATSGEVIFITKTSTVMPAQFTSLSTATGNVVSISAIAVGVGVGVGLGLPIVILVVIVCVVCACRKKASKTRDETKPENKDNVSEHTDENGYSMADSTLPGQRTSTHLTVVDNNVYASADCIDVKPSSPSAVALRPQPEGGNNAQVYDEIRMSMINSIMTKTNGHVSKATSPPPALPQDVDFLTVSESAISLNGSQTDLTLVDSAIYSSNGTGMQLRGGEADTATAACEIDGNTIGEASES